MELLVFAILFTVTDAQESQLSGPENTLSVVGSNVTLKCSSPPRYCNGTEWLKYGASSSPVTVFNDRGIISSAFGDRYSVDNSSGCDLIIKNVELTDAGRFICRAFISSNTVDGTAHLVTLTTQPKCTTNASLNDTVEADIVQLTCEVTYNGTHNASMAWDGVEDAPAAVESGKTIRRSYSAVASAPKVPSSICNTSFVIKTMESESREVIIGMATNMPEASCETPVIKVMYSVRDVQLSPSLSSYPLGSNITCSAKGHPPPTFKWQKMEDDNATWVDIQNLTGNEFTLNDSSSNWYRCVAMNNVRDINYSNTSDEFQINNTRSDATPSLPITIIISIGAGVGVGILLPLIILLIVCFCARCYHGYRCCHSEKKSNGGVARHITDHEMRSSSSHQPSPINPSIPRTKASLVGEQESSVYAGLGKARAANEYASLEESKKIKPKKKSKP